MRVRGPNHSYFKSGARRSIDPQEDRRSLRASTPASDSFRTETNCCSSIKEYTRSVYRGVEGKTKTRASRKPVPLPLLVIEEFKLWRKTSLYRTEDDFLFPSIQKNGTQPVQPEMILRRHIRPALERLNINKRIGWHSFRHGFSNLLRQNGVEVKTAQELLRHANSRITMDIYQRTVTEERREAQARAFEVLMASPKNATKNRTTMNHNPIEKEEVLSVSA
jgi:hypothetical protein